MHDYVRKQRVLRYEVAQRLLELRSGNTEAMVRALCSRYWWKQFRELNLACIVHNPDQML